jgi:hypothetical protein
MHKMQADSLAELVRMAAKLELPPGKKYLFPYFAQSVLRRSPSPISEAGIIEYRLEDRLQPIEQRLLTHAVIDRWDGQRELHTNTVSFWDGPRPGILFTRFVGKASQYLRHGG